MEQTELFVMEPKSSIKVTQPILLVGSGDFLMIKSFIEEHKSLKREKIYGAEIFKESDSCETNPVSLKAVEKLVPHGNIFQGSLPDFISFLPPILFETIILDFSNLKKPEQEEIESKIKSLLHFLFEIQKEGCRIFVRTKEKTLEWISSSQIVSENYEEEVIESSLLSNALKEKFKLVCLNRKSENEFLETCEKLKSTPLSKEVTHYLQKHLSAWKTLFPSSFAS